jgi:Lysophospholipase L1 and related esterases
MEEKKPCKFCGALLPSNAKFCTSCGSFLPSSLLSPSKRANQRPKRQPKNTGLRNESDRRQVLGNRRSSKFQLTSKRVFQGVVLLIFFLILAVIVGGALHIPTGGNTTTTTVSSSLQALHAHSIVCVGDSITEGLADPNNWPNHLKTRLGGDWQVINQGVGGDKTADMFARIDEALASNPHFVIISGGTNDLANGDVPLATTQANIREMCTQIESHGAVPVLCTVPPNNYSLEQRDILNGWIAEYANSKGYGLIDFYAVIDNPANPGHSNPLLVMSDGIHPNAAGYSAMGNAIDLGIFTAGN